MTHLNHPYIYVYDIFIPSRSYYGERRQFQIRVLRNEYFESLRVPPVGLGFPPGPRQG